MILARDTIIELIKRERDDSRLWEIADDENRNYYSGMVDMCDKLLTEIEGNDDNQ